MHHVQTDRRPCISLALIQLIRILQRQTRVYLLSTGEVFNFSVDFGSVEHGNLTHQHMISLQGETLNY